MGESGDGRGGDDVCDPNQKLDASAESRALSVMAVVEMAVVEGTMEAEG